MNKVLVIILGINIFIIQSCSHAVKQEMTLSAASMIDTAQASCPYLTSDNKGNIVLSWIKEKNAEAGVLCYAVSSDGGKTFDSAIEIPGSSNVLPHGENMPKLIFKPSGETIAVWGTANPNPKNKYSGLVYYAQSFDAGKTWSHPANLVKDPASFDQRYFDVALLPTGEAAIVWLDNRKTSAKEGSGLYYAVTNGNTGFSNEKLISEPCCQCCRTNLFVDHNKNIHVVYRAIINDSIRDMAHVVSADNGVSFSTPERISNDNWVINGCPHTGPAMAENKEGMHFTWFTAGSGAGIYYNQSRDNGKTFSQRNSVSGRSAKHCQIVTLPDDNILIVWNETFAYHNDFSSRIGVEERSADGKPSRKQYITAENGSASFPVIHAVDANTALVAYIESTKEKDHVMYKRIGL